MDTGRKAMNNRFILGLLLVVIGALLILNNYFNIFGNFSFWWPALLILIGLMQLLKRSTSTLWAMLLIAVGLLFLGKNIGLIPGKLMFPIALILIGCCFIFSRLGTVTHDNTDQVNYFTLFSSLQTNNQAQDFKGGSVAAVFGGSEVNFRQAQMSDQGAVLELTAVFGGIDIIVPNHWKVQVTGTPIFGGWENKTTYHAENENDNEQILKVNCIAVFGGITIKN